MSDTKMLQLLLDGQAAIRKDIAQLDKMVNDKVDGVEMRLTTRINNLGKQIAILDGDAPSSEEIKALGKRVKKLEIKVASFSTS